MIEFPVSTYYAVKKREKNPSRRALVDEELLPLISRRVGEEGETDGRGTEGVETAAPRGVEVARCTVERLMGEDGMSGVAATCRQPRTTVPGDESRRPRDLVERDFCAPAPNQLWVTGSTYVELAGGGFCYAAFVSDAFSRAIVGWQVADSVRTGLALDALEMALRTRKDKLSKALVHHGDRGVQYAAIRYADRLADAGIGRSVGRKGDSCDNALAASVNALYKKEVIGQEDSWTDVTEATPATANGFTGTIMRGCTRGAGTIHHWSSGSVRQRTRSPRKPGRSITQ